MYIEVIGDIFRAVDTATHMVQCLVAAAPLGVIFLYFVAGWQLDAGPAVRSRGDLDWLLIGKRAQLREGAKRISSRSASKDPGRYFVIAVVSPIAMQSANTSPTEVLDRLVESKRRRLWLR